MIRILLLISLLFIGIITTLGRNSHSLKASRKMLFVLILGLGSMAVLFPEEVTLVANWVGVGRGTDLLLYIMTLVTLSFMALSYVDKKKASFREAVLVGRLALLESQIEELNSKSSDLR